MNLQEEIEGVPNLICVEYPGQVRNPEKMMETLGGIEEISRVSCTCLNLEIC
jgi:hypothetical protein